MWFCLWSWSVVARCLGYAGACVSRRYGYTLLLVAALSGLTAPQLDGTIPVCSEEGADFYVPGISDDPCINCVCMSGQVQCMKQQCADIEGCHMVLYELEEIRCCQTCRGCYFGGQDFESGAVWSDPTDTCRAFECKAGVVTISDITCQATCSNPFSVPGQCCPVCRGCYSNGVPYRNGQMFPAPGDICATCKCQNGTVSCRKRACPVLNCVDEHVTTLPGACCPVCRGTRQVFDLKKRACLFKNAIVANDRVTKPDRCTDCVCLEGTLVCKREVCPPIACPENHYVIHDNTSCCPRCERPRRACRFRANKYEDGVTWQPDDCTHCSCTDGVVHCQVQQCSNEIYQCPQNAHLQRIAGKCCPECVDDAAVCTVFGDPHYRTFDGLIYNFQGLCNYILARDCGGSRDFSIHVRNDARSTNDFAWTKSVIITMSRLKVYLFRNFRVKINRKRIRIPFDGFGIKVSGNPHTLTVKTATGVKVIWDGDSYLEVSVPPQYKQHMCGLCGNYNNDEHDDLTGRDEVLYYSPEEFGETWRIGQKLLCIQENSLWKAGRKMACQSKDEKREARNKCSVFRSKALELCSKVLRSQPYYESCVTDVCDCPEGKNCACEAVTAYIRECQRHGVSLPWPHDICESHICEANQEWSECSDACPVTCNNLHRQPRTCTRICQPGCGCIKGYVLNNNQCVPSEMCRDVDTETGSRKRGRDRNPTPNDNWRLLLQTDTYSESNDRTSSLLTEETSLQNFGRTLHSKSATALSDVSNFKRRRRKQKDS